MPDGEEGEEAAAEAPKEEEAKADKPESEDLGAKQLEGSNSRINILFILANKWTFLPLAMEKVEIMASAKTSKAEPSPFAHIDFKKIANKLVSFLARNFFTLKLIALVIAFTINFMLLFYKVRE